MTPSKNTIRTFGIFCLTIGILLNKWILAALFSPDGILGTGTSRLIWSFNILIIVAGWVLLKFSSELASTGPKSVLLALIKSAGPFYVLACTSLVTAILFLVGINALAPALGDSIHQKEIESRKEFNKKRRAVYTHLSESDMHLLLNETWSRPYRYAPWVGFQEEPRAGKFVNVSNAGFRSCGEKQSLELDDLKIFVFGGSTTFGYGVEDSSTIPAFLQKHLRNGNPGRNISVFNFGRGWYYSHQETALLLHLLQLGYIPDLVVFVDGFNEGQAQPHYTEEMERLFETRNELSNKALVKMFIEKLPIVQLIKDLKSDASKPGFYRALNPEEIQTTYASNRKVINRLGEEYGFTSYFFIQPVGGYKNSFSQHELKSEWYDENLQHVWKKIQFLEELMDGKKSFSMAHLLQDYPEQPFVDTIHYTPAVNNMIAKFISDKINLPATRRL